jgi:salicylate hydroxylase
VAYQPSYSVHRVDLHNELVRLATSPDGPGHPCKLSLGSAVADCDPEAGTVTLGDGRTLHADLLIAADGVKVSASYQTVSLWV